MSSQIPPDCVGVALVDDDAMALAHLESYFSGVEDLSVLLATRSTHEALRFVQSHQVDVLITDVHMENMDGVEMTREVLRSSPPTRVILLTTIDTDEDLLQGLGAGARDVLRLLCEGASNRKIASLLTIAEATVKSHITGLFHKTGTTSRLEMVVWAFKHGYASNSPFTIPSSSAPSSPTPGSSPSPSELRSPEH